MTMNILDTANHLRKALDAGTPDDLEPEWEEGVAECIERGLLVICDHEYFCVKEGHDIYEKHSLALAKDNHDQGYEDKPNLHALDVVYVIYHEDPTGYDGDSINGIDGFVVTEAEAVRVVDGLNMREPECSDCGGKHRRYAWKSVSCLTGVTMAINA